VKNNKRPTLLWILVILLFFVGLSALISGAMLFVSPEGSLLGMSTDLLDFSPFSSYLIPGIVLFLFIGVFSMFAGYGLLKTPNWHWPNLVNPSKSYHWAWTTAWAEGVIMLIWIGIETILLGYISFLQPLIAGWGILTIGLTLLPPVRRYYKEGNPDHA
jgi:hypothetical protein